MRLNTTLALRPASRTLLPNLSTQQSRTAAQSANALKYRRKDQASASKKTKKKRSHFLEPDLKKAQQFSLVDAMRFVPVIPIETLPLLTHTTNHRRLTR